MIKKTQIDKKVASIAGVDPAIVTKVTRLFLETLRNHIVTERKVQLSGFGTFTLTERRGTRAPMLTLLDGTQVDALHSVQYVVTFSKATPFRQAVEAVYGKGRDRMEKYAVDEEVDQEALEKSASEGCPDCGRTVEKHGKTLICPACGSAPFEKKKKR